MALIPKQFHTHVLRWYDQYGRKGLPWQHEITPYRVWVSEIMLQQTQVNTVIPYFLRFMAKFPTVNKLAAATMDEVLHLWTGLGYYARARNLHHAAQVIVSQYAGKFPQDLNELQNLPGIGRSTAGAILALASEHPAAILDGNVKRLFTRLYAVEGWPGEVAVSKQLWEIAEHLVPTQQVRAYTQALMDLGAMVCTRSKPHCHACPFSKHCLAYQQQRVQEFPYAKPLKDLAVKQVTFLLLENERAEILLQQRPPVGIWGGLWSFPEWIQEHDLKQWCKQHWQCQILKKKQLASFRHTFSHFHLDITPIHLQVKLLGNVILDSATTVWYNIAEPPAVGLAAPVKKILATLGETIT